jgi:hypothetical protein
MSLHNLRTAAAKGDMASIQNLLKKWDVNDLWDAAAKGDMEEVKKVLKRAFRYQQDCRKATKRMLRSYLQSGLTSTRGLAGALETALYAASYINDTALHKNNDDSSEKRIQVVKWLIDMGANINVKSGMHGNALTAASAEGNENIDRLLLEHDADPNARGNMFTNALQLEATSRESAPV